MAPESRFQLRTERGYDFFEVSSTLQKEIRRGSEEDAVYWAFEFIPRFENYLWKRLKVILNEDIGIANPGLIPIIECLENQYFQIKDTLTVVNAVLLMARSPKTRIACHLSIIMEQGHSQNLPLKKVPDFALDMHTAKGRALGRDLKHFRKVGAVLNNEVDVGDVYQDRCYELLKTKKKYVLKAGPQQSQSPKDPNGKLAFDEEE